MTPEMRAALMFAGTIFSVLAWLLAHGEEGDGRNTY